MFHHIHDRQRIAPLVVREGCVCCDVPAVRVFLGIGVYDDEAMFVGCRGEVFNFTIVC